MRSFSGAANVYRRFIKNFFRTAKPLNSRLKKDAKPNWHEPTQEAREAFDYLKKKLIAPPVLALPKRGCPSMIDTPSVGRLSLRTRSHSASATRSNRTSGALLVTGPRPWKADQKYSATECECYSVVWAVTTLWP